MNQNKAVPIIITSIVIIGVALMVFARPSKEKTEEAPSVVQQEQVSESTLPTQNPTTPSSSAKSYTMETVATHNTQSDCWTTINGSVYNVTSWISKHPGGAGAIIGLCGKDGSSAFNGQHGGDRRPASELASFKIGALSK